MVLDIANNPGVDLVMDARELLKSASVQDDSFDAVYCSHALEHFAAHEVAGVLAGMKRVLKPGGQIEVRVPNMTTVFAKLGAGADINDVAYNSTAGPIHYRDIIYGLGSEIEQSGTENFAHKTGFTEQRLGQVLQDAGFTQVYFSEEQFSEFDLRMFATKPESAVVAEK